MGPWMKAGSRGTQREKEDLDFGLFLLKSMKTLLQKNMQKLRFRNCRHINAPHIKILLLSLMWWIFYKSMCLYTLKTSNNQSFLFQRNGVIVHFYLKQPTSTPVSPCVLANEIKSEWANCMCEGSWKTLWRPWRRSEVLILFHKCLPRATFM